MSFSFNVRADSKAGALAMIATELDSVVADQPDFAADRAQVEASASAFIALCVDPGDGEEVFAAISGWIDTLPDAGGVSGVGVGVQVTVKAKAA